MTSSTDTPPLLPLALERAATAGRRDPVRSWTPLGTVDAGAIAEVDGAGLVALRGAGWSLDWWIGAEDRWHHPSREAAVRQSHLGDAPVVETAMRVPGGDVVHRAYAVRAGSGAADERWEDSAVVVEIENLTAVPVALAFAVRPYLLDGPGRIGRVAADGAVIRVDGMVVAVLSRPPARAALGAVGEPAASLERGEDRDADGAVLVADDDRGEAAFVVPLPHTSTVRVLLPRVDDGSRRGRLLGRRRRARIEPDATWDAPDWEPVVSGWEAHTRDAARVELPDPLLGPALAASQRTLLVAATDVSRFPHAEDDPSAAAARVTWAAEALARSGLVEPLGPIARGLVRAQRLNGSVELADGSDAAIALIAAAAPLLATGAPGWVDDLLGPAAKAVHRLGRSGGTLDGTAVESLGRLAAALRRIDQPDVAAAADELCERRNSEWGGAEARGTGDRSSDWVAARAADVRDQIRRGDPTAAASLVELCRLGSPGTVVDRLDDQGTPTGDLGTDVAAVANRAGAVLDAALIEGDEGPVLLPAWPEQWWGQPAEAHGVRTRWGVVSFGVRWHGERPAILWEVEPAEGVDRATAPVLTAPALDPTWRGEGWSGEALLAPVAVPATLVAIRGTGASESGPDRPDGGRDDVGDVPPPDEGASFS